MRVHWTAPTTKDLCQIAYFIRRDSPAAARNVAKTLSEGCEGLKDMPYRGSQGSREGTRELTFPGLPYVAIYRLTGDVAEILHLWHGAQDWR